MTAMNKIAKLYFGKTPAVVCTAGSYIALVNEAAQDALSGFHEERYLFDSMDPWDVLKYEATFLSQRDRVTMSFPLHNFYSYKNATAVFERIMGRRFAVVYLSRGEASLSGEDMEKRDVSPDALAKAFIGKLIGLRDSVFDCDDRLGLMDLRESVRRAVSSVEKDIDCRIRITENAAANGLEHIPVDVPLNSFLQMTMLLLSAVSTVCAERRIEVKIVCCNDERELRIYTDTGRLKRRVYDVDALIEEAPALSVLLSTCSYVAGCTDCSLTVRTDSESGRLCASLVFCDTETEKVDFKSRDPYKYFEKEISFVKKYMDVFV